MEFLSLSLLQRVTFEIYNNVNFRFTAILRFKFCFSFQLWPSRIQVSLDLLRLSSHCCRSCSSRWPSYSFTCRSNNHLAPMCRLDRPASSPLLYHCSSPPLLAALYGFSHPLAKFRQLASCWWVFFLLLLLGDVAWWEVPNIMPFSVRSGLDR